MTEYSEGSEHERALSPLHTCIYTTSSTDPKPPPPCAACQAGFLRLALVPERIELVLAPGEHRSVTFTIHEVQMILMEEMARRLGIRGTFDSHFTYTTKGHDLTHVMVKISEPTTA